MSRIAQAQRKYGDEIGLRLTDLRVTTDVVGELTSSGVDGKQVVEIENRGGFAREVGFSVSSDGAQVEWSTDGEPPVEVWQEDALPPVGPHERVARARHVTALGGKDHPCVVKVTVWTSRVDARIPVTCTPPLLLEIPDSSHGR